MAGGGQQTSTSQTSVDPAVSAMQKSLFDSGTGMLSGFLNNPSTAVAGFSPDQTAGFNLSRYAAQNAFSPDSAGWQAPTSASSASATLIDPNSLGRITAPQIGGVTNANAKFQPGSAEQLSPDEIGQFIDPYTKSVMDSTMANMQRQKGIDDAGRKAQYAMSGGFGGSREAIAQGQADRAFGEQVASTGANLMSDAFKTASGIAGQNVANRQQTATNNTSIGNNMLLSQALANASAANTHALSQAQLDMQGQTANLGAVDDALARNSQLKTSTDLTNAANANNYAIQRSGLSNTMLNDEQARQLKAITGLLQTGQMQQTQGQNVLNTPWTMLQKLSDITPKQVGTSTTSTQPNNTPNPIMQILPLLGSLFL